MPHLLLIEDNQHIQRIWATKLQAEGFKVTTAEDGEQGLSLAETCNPDAVLLDIMLPKLNGFEVLQRLSADPSLCQIPVYMLSNKAWVEDVERALSLGARQFFTKGSSTLHNIVAQIRAECGFKKLMIVTPNADAAKVIRSVVEHPELLCVVSSVIPEAPSAIERGAPDLVLLDARNVAPQVLSVLQHLRTNSATSAIRIIAVTDEPEKIQRADECVSSAQIGSGLRQVVLKSLGLTDAAETAVAEHAPVA